MRQERRAPLSLSGSRGTRSLVQSGRRTATHHGNKNEICQHLHRARPDCRDLFPRTSDVRAEPVRSCRSALQGWEVYRGRRHLRTNRRPRSEGLFGGPSARPGCLARQPARRRAEMVGSGHRSAARRRRCQGHAGRSVLSPRRLPKGGGCAQRSRGRQQQTDHRAISDFECREAGELQGPDAL